MLRRPRQSVVFFTIGLLTLLIAANATAGTNGQQIKVYEQTNIGSLCVYGYNQNASWVNQCFTAPARIYNYTTIGGWWWKSYFGTDPLLDYYGSSSLTNYLGSNSCYVPEYQPGNDWTICYSVS